MAASQGNKVIITCAVTGSIHTPTMSPHLPITPSECQVASEGISPLNRSTSMSDLSPGVRRHQ